MSNKRGFLFTLFAIRIINNVTVSCRLGILWARYRRRVLSRKCHNRTFFGPSTHIYIGRAPDFFLGVGVSMWGKLPYTCGVRKGKRPPPLITNRNKNT